MTLAPDFTAAATGGQDITLSALRGQTVVLFFYPRDNTPGCTTENQQFRDLYPQFQAAGVRVFGISRDTLKSHDNFRCKQELPFDLIADTEETVCSLFGVIKQKMMYGKPVQGIERSTFVIGPDGSLLREWRGVKVDGHAQAVLEFVQGLGQ